MSSKNRLAKQLLLTFAVLLAAPSSARADDGSPGHMLSLDVGRFVYSLARQNNAIVLPLEFEGAVDHMVSLFMAPRLVVHEGAVGLGLGVGIRFYLLAGPALRGLWLGPEVGVLYATANESSIVANIALSLGGSVGYNILLGQSLMLSPGINFGVIGVGGRAAVIDFSPRLVLGYAF